MSAPDFAAILAATLADVTGEPSRMFDIECTEMLAARVPELCNGQLNGGCPCPDCPTIGQLLAKGAAVMGELVDAGAGDVFEHKSGTYMDGPELLAYLRAVQP